MSRPTTFVWTKARSFSRSIFGSPNETPYSAIHLENMLRVTRAGAVVLPASPGYYHRPRTIADLVDFIVGRVLSHIGVMHDLGPRWQSGEGE